MTDLNIKKTSKQKRFNENSMRKFLLSICFGLLAVPSAIAQNFKYLGQTPADGAEIAALQDVVLQFDLTDTYAAYPSNSDKSLWQIRASWKTVAVPYGAKLFRGTDITADPLYSFRPTTQQQKGTAGTEEYSFRLDDKDIMLEPGETYTLWMANNFRVIYNGSSVKNVVCEGDGDTILVTLKGRAATSDELFMTSYAPTQSDKLEQFSTFTMKFNRPVSVDNQSTVEIYEGDEVVGSSTDIVVDPANDSIVNVLFDTPTVYNGHTYSVIVPEGTVMSKDGAVKYGKRTFGEYSGSYRKPECTFISATPEDGSTVEYLAGVSMKISTPKNYCIGSVSKGSMKMYKNDETEPIASYALSVEGINTVGITANNYQLEPLTTYRLVLPAGLIVPRKSGVNNSTGDLKDITNPEITITYTTPAEFTSIPRVDGLSISASEAGLVRVMVPPFTFNGATTFVRPSASSAVVTSINDAGEEKVRTFVTLPLYEVTDGEDKQIATVKFEYNPLPDETMDNYTSLDVKPSVSLYKDHTYKVVIPEGTLYAYTLDGMYNNATFWNLSTPLTFAGTEEAPTSIGAHLASGFSAKGADGQIAISGLASGSVVAAYNAVGMLAASAVATDGSALLSVPAGAYIVKAGKAVVKVIVK